MWRHWQQPESPAQGEPAWVAAKHYSGNAVAQRPHAGGGVELVCNRQESSGESGLLGFRNEVLPDIEIEQDDIGVRLRHTIHHFPHAGTFGRQKEAAFGCQQAGETRTKKNLG